MLRSASTVIAIFFLATSGLRADEKSDVRENQQWYYDANGNLDSCKVGLPPPHARLPPEDRAMYDRGIEACHRNKTSAAEQEIKRREDMAAQRASERSAALRQEEAHRRYLEQHHLTSVSVVDLQANGKDMVGGRVAVTGYVRILSEDLIGIYTNSGDINGVRLDLSQATPQSRRRIFGFCSDINNPCQIEVAGTVGFDDHVLVHVE